MWDTLIKRILSYLFWIPADNFHGSIFVNLDLLLNLFSVEMKWVIKPFICIYNGNIKGHYKLFTAINSYRFLILWNILQYKMLHLKF